MDSIAWPLKFEVLDPEDNPVVLHSEWQALQWAGKSHTWVDANGRKLKLDVEKTLIVEELRP